MNVKAEWDALCIVHKMSNALGLGIHFNYAHSIDITDGHISQIVDEDIYLDRSSFGKKK